MSLVLPNFLRANVFMDKRENFSMQEATVAEQSSKIFTDVREVEITRAIADEFHMMY